MAHDLSGIFPEYPRANVGETGLPELLDASAEVAIFSTPGCVGCRQAQRENHHSNHAWCLVHKDTKRPWYGANPIPSNQRPVNLWRQLMRSQEWLHLLEKWTAGWWANRLGGLWGISNFNGADSDGSIGFNFIDGYWLEITSVSGDLITVDCSVRDLRNWYWQNGPVQVGDLCLIGGNNRAAGAMPYIEPGGSSFTPSAGLVFSKPSTATFKISQDLAPAINLKRDEGQPLTRYVFIAREASYPQKWIQLAYPDYFFGVPMTKILTPSSPEWADGIVTLKDWAGNDCCVAAPNPSPQSEDERTLIVVARDAFTGEWEEVDVSGYQGVPSRSALYVDRLQVNGNVTINLKLKSAATVTSGMFATSYGSLSGFTGSGSAYSIGLSGVTGTRQVDVTFDPGAIEDANGVPVDPASIRLDYNDSRPALALAESTIDIEDEDENPHVKYATITTSEFVTGLTESDLTLSGCYLDYLYRINETSYQLSLLHHWGGASASVSIAENLCSNLSGLLNTASNTLAVSAVSSPNALPCFITASEPFHTNSASWTCVLQFSEAVTNVTSSMLELQNCKIENWTKINDLIYTFDVVPKKIIFSGAPGSEVVDYDDLEQGIVTVKCPAGVVEQLSHDGDPYENGPSNLFVRSYDATSFDITIVADTPTVTSGVEARCHALMGKEVVDFTASSLTVTNCTVKNFKRLGSRYEWSLIPTSYNVTATCKVLANAVHDLAGNGNRASNLNDEGVGVPVSIQFLPEGTGSNPTNSRLYISHPFASTTHSGAVSKLYLRSLVNGVANYEDLLANADAVRIDYYAETTRTDYANKPVAIYSRRCRYSIPDYGGMWGVGGHDGKGWKWLCSLRNMTPKPKGLKNYASACYLCGNCQYFEPMRFEDFLQPTTVMEVLRQLWVGLPGVLRQIVPGISTPLNWIWQRINNPSISSFLTPPDQMKNAPMPGVAHWHPQGCGHFGRLLEDGTSQQGLAHVFVDDPDDQPLLNSSQPPDGVLPALLTGWKDGRTKQRIDAPMDSSSDPYGSWRNWYGHNAWGWYRDGGGLPTDLGNIRYRRMSKGTQKESGILLPNIDLTSTATVYMTNGEYQQMWLDADFQPTTEELAVYGGVVRIRPVPWSGDGGASPTGLHTIRRIETISGGIRIHVDPSPIAGTQGMVIPGWGQATTGRLWYSGGNAVGWPETYRTNNEGVDYLNSYSHLYCSLGPEKGIREGHVIQFPIAGLHHATGTAQRPRKFYALVSDNGGISYDSVDSFHYALPITYSAYDSFVGDYVTFHEPRAFEVLKATACAGDGFNWDDGTDYATKAWNATVQEEWFNSYVSTCLTMPPKYFQWGHYCDTLDIADPDGFLAAEIAAGNIGPGSLFCAMNGYSTFNADQAEATWEWANYQQSAWTAFGEGEIVCIDKINGCYAITKAALATLSTAPKCLKATVADGRVSYTPYISADDLNQPIQAMTVLDTFNCQIATTHTAIPVYAYYGMVSYWGLPQAPINWPGFKHFSTSWTLESGIARRGDPCAVVPTTNQHIPVLHYTEAVPEWQAVVDLVEGIDPIANGDQKFFSGIDGASSNFEYDVSAYMNFNQPIDVIRIPVIQDLLPDDCVIIDAWAEVSASAESIRKWQVGIIMQGMLENQTDYGFVGIASDLVSQTVRDEVNFAGDYTPIYDSSTDPDPTDVYASLIGWNEDGVFPLGGGISVPADGEPHLRNVKSLVEELYAHRHDGYIGIGFLTTSTATGMGFPNVIETGAYTDESGGVTYVGLKCENIEIIGAAVGFSNLVVQFRTPSGVLHTLNGAAPRNLPPMD